MEYKSQILAEDKFKGNYHGSGSMVLTGTFDGNLSVDNLLIAKSGKFLGKVIAKNIVVEGILKADVEVDKIEVKADGSVEGDLMYRHLVIDEGGFLNSSKVVKMTDSKALKRFNSA